MNIDFKRVFFSNIFRRAATEFASISLKFSCFQWAWNIFLITTPHIFFKD